ncbi:MAG: toll/interleukin-1 receptor domain-containing protein [Anaerolineae bacterium]|nr:toll/interleukin-1 receptor domain-containing protein [Anaerolineae bacterium]
MDDPRRRDEELGDQDEFDLDELGRLTRETQGVGELFDEDDEAEITEAYCVRCRHMVEILDPVPVWTSKGTPGTRGVCADCGTTVFRMGKTHAHDALVRPHAVRVETLTKIATSGKRRAQPATYINFARADLEFARRLATDLEHVGIHTWIDTDSEASKDVPWAGGVHPALRDSARMVAILSDAALADKDFGEAWQFFKSQKKPIVLAVIDVLDVPDPLRRSPRFAFSRDNAKTYQKAFRQMVIELGE